MKKLLVLLITFTLLFTSTSVFAASDFINNKELDATFAELEKAFLKSEQVYMPLNCLFDPITGPVFDEVLPQMTDAVLKAAVEERLNEIRVALEIEEERLGGLSKEEYKMISDQLLQKCKTNSGEFYWEEGNKTVWLTFGLSDDEFVEFEGLVGNFERMNSKEKDTVSQADLQVADRIRRYLNQSVQVGNTVSPDIIKELPGKLDILFKELQPPKFIASKAIAKIHEHIYDTWVERFDGSESVESVVENYRSMIEEYMEDRDYDRQIENFKFPADSPSPEVRKDFAEMIMEGELSETFTSGYSNPITLGELAKLYFESEELDERIQLEKTNVYVNSPDYIKLAYIYGMINSGDDLKKPLTRLEAARRLVNRSIYIDSEPSKILEINDAAKIPAEDLVAVAESCMDIRGINFEPQSMYTKEEAIVDSTSYTSERIRGYNVPVYLSELSRVLVGENTIHLQFESKEQLEEYMQSNFEDDSIESIGRNGSYMRIDTGCALIELFTPEKGIKFTFKNGVKFADFDEEVYGPELEYKIEARVLKAGEIVNMNLQPDSLHEKLYQKLDAVLTKLITPGMTTEQKVKAIHDYVVTHVRYDGNVSRDYTPKIERVLMTLDDGRGVCMDYIYLFEYLCNRASIPCVSEGGVAITNPASPTHGWNAVFINGEWKFVDTTWDDGNEKQISYKYFLNDRFTFMNEHTPQMGVPAEHLYPEIDPMNIKTQDELRVYLDRDFYYVDGYKLTFRLTDKTIKPFTGYLWPGPHIRVVLTYDANNDLYTIEAKK